MDTITVLPTLARITKVIALITVVAATLISISPCSVASTQQLSELDFIVSRNPLQNAPGESRISLDPAPSRTLGIKGFFTGMIRFYQLFISTQDMPVCNFVPSCSQFGMKSIRQFGIIRGILLTSDRLQRCNSMSTTRYEIDYNSGKLVDPVQTYIEILR